MKAFDRKFGADFLGKIPLSAGVYRVYDSQGALIYVGKAKNLRRRLAQYRNAKRRKKHARMKAVVAGAAHIEVEPCAGETEALLRENQLIRDHRPRLNIAGAFSFLYPFLGVRHESGNTYFCLSSRPELHPGFSFHGCFRSRALTREGFRALLRLLEYIGHSIPRSRLPGAPDRFAIRAGYRRLPSDWVARLEGFWRGESLDAIEALVLGLVENAAARGRGGEIQRDLNLLREFWKVECQPLARARDAAAYLRYPVPQAERDALLIRMRSGVGRSGHG